MADQKEPIQWVTKKDWNEFRETGLFMFMNTLLHAFGWAICVELEEGTGKVLSCYPARVKFRGFSEADQDEMHPRIGKYLEENATELRKETEL